MKSKHVKEGEGLAVKMRILEKLEESALIEGGEAPEQSTTRADVA